MKKNISVIISTYNSPKWLKKVFLGYNTQTYRNFELIIADDGSSQETFDLIEAMKEEVFYSINHVWHEDIGFRKTIILNKALLVSTTDYIIMSDGDCIPREDFIEKHVFFREEGYFLSGGYHKIPLAASKKINKEDIYSGECFNVSWLKKNEMGFSFKNSKLKIKGFMNYLLNKFTPTTTSWNGHNASGWKKDMIEINGFDERMQYGGEDREFGERLLNNGIQSKQIRYSAICLHLDHPRGYVKPEMLEKNAQIRQKTNKSKSKWTDFGILKKV